MAVLPPLKERGKNIETAEQGNGRIPHEGAFRLCGTYGYAIRYCLIREPPPQPHDNRWKNSISHGRLPKATNQEQDLFPLLSLSKARIPCQSSWFFFLRGS